MAATADTEVLVEGLRVAVADRMAVVLDKLVADWADVWDTELAPLWEKAARDILAQQTRAGK